MINRLKRIFAFALLLGASVVQGQDTMYVAQKVGGWVKFPVDNIDSVTFKKAKQTVDLAIGKTYQGGIIAYICQPGDPGYIEGQIHGLIVAPSDQSTGIQWYNGSYTVTGTGTALGTGVSNTSKIVAVQGAGSYAAKLCDDLVLGGYSDWFLPSKDELNKLYLNKTLIGSVFVKYPYWSSSNDDTLSAWGQLFFNGSQYNYDKSYTYSVRAVRAF